MKPLFPFCCNKLHTVLHAGGNSPDLLFYIDILPFSVIN